MELSIVTGTYNRLHSLQRMVQSVWNGLYHKGFIDFEIVVVDGGSTDGTIEWCKRTPKLRLIEQGKLLGAVKAFNEGARSANGSYVILANDDITFLGNSLLNSYIFMQENHRVGMGCFYQDRDNKQFHVSSMRATSPDGDLVSVVYGQVCIVPKAIGDYYGWWGNYLHTYGGDNELSCHIWESGLYVAPIKDAAIKDWQIKDELRDINNGSTLENELHPDTIAWKDKWFPTGPMINSMPLSKEVSRVARKKRIMYFPLIEKGNTLQMMTKVGLRYSLAKYGTVLQHDYVNRGMGEIITDAAQWKPDLFVFQIQNHDPQLIGLISKLKSMHPTAKFVNWNGDYHPANLYDSKYMLDMLQFDLCGFVVEVDEIYDTNKINWFYWQIGYEISNAQPTEDTPAHDVVFLGNCYSEQRKALGSKLMYIQDIFELDIGLYGNWPANVANGNNLYDFDEGARLYRNAKIAISTQQYPEAFGFVSNRLFQAMSAGGCVVLQQEFEGMEDFLGYKDGEHLLVWRDLDHLHDLIIEILADEDRRKQIARQGQLYTIHNHSFDNRVAELWEELYGRS